MLNMEMNIQFEDISIDPEGLVFITNGEESSFNEICTSQFNLCLYVTNNTCRSCLADIAAIYNRSDVKYDSKIIVFLPLTSARLADKIHKVFSDEIQTYSSNDLDKLFGLMSETPILFTISKEKEIHHVFKVGIDEAGSTEVYFSDIRNRYYPKTD